MTSVKAKRWVSETACGKELWMDSGRVSPPKPKGSKYVTMAEYAKKLNAKRASMGAQAMDK